MYKLATVRPSRKNTRLSCYAGLRTERYSPSSLWQNHVLNAKVHRPAVTATIDCFFSHGATENLSLKSEVGSADKYLFLHTKNSEQEAEARLNEPSADEVLLNPLLWWKVYALIIISSIIFIWSCFQIHAVEFPVIARMARDYLAIPATSVAVERVFSKSCHICANLRSSLKEKTIMMALLTKVWIRSGLFEMTAPTELQRKHGDNGKKWGPYIPTVL